ncbi:hypothetical protein FRC19_007701 [Serendipita sp. 401]|nr:hypothetical protein FRC19_007701 [Serendipita sp. 401]KAG8815963.1 hypothetical protein FRC18_001236 [Serendipita sp. 400]KAG9042180.1 hypothetical protein FS842_002272 [Serendipita sp. 407]
MALKPSMSPYLIIGERQAPNTLEMFWDYVCPYSAKSANAMETILKPLLESKYPNKVKVIFRPQPQPWHSSSTLVHEAGLAVSKVAPNAFWQYSLALFKAQDQFYDVPASTMTPSQIREKLADLGKTSGTLSDQEVEAVKQALVLNTKDGARNGGVSVTDDLKFCIKYSRQNSIHVSPTVLWNGLVANEVSSSWGEKEWDAFLEPKVE